MNHLIGLSFHELGTEPPSINHNQDKAASGTMVHLTGVVSAAALCLALFTLPADAKCATRRDGSRDPKCNDDFHSRDTVRYMTSYAPLWQFECSRTVTQRVSVCKYNVSYHGYDKLDTISWIR